MNEKTDLQRVRSYAEDITFYTDLIDTLKKAIEKIQLACNHEYHSAGRTHGYNYEKCQKCGKTIKT